MTPSDLPGDPGLEPTALAFEGRPFVGAPPRGEGLERLALDAELDRVLLELHRGFGWQRWWPAATAWEVVVGAVLTQHTSWRNVEHALARLRAREALTPARVLALGDEELLEAVRPSGTYRAKARVLRGVSRWYLAAGGLAALRDEPLERVRAGLLGVWGVGPETADSILCYAAGRRVVVVDAYARRVLGRHRLGPADAPYEELRAWLEARLVDSLLVAQETHALFVRAGYDNCKPTPDCDGCPATAP